MPFKANAARRHHIPKQKRKVTNSCVGRFPVGSHFVLLHTDRLESEKGCPHPATPRVGAYLIDP
jgi:hypothetical protein